MKTQLQAIEVRVGRLSGFGHPFHPNTTPRLSWKSRAIFAAGALAGAAAAVAAAIGGSLLFRRTLGSLLAPGVLSVAEGIVSALVGVMAALLLEALAYRGLSYLTERHESNGSDSWTAPQERWSWYRLVGQYYQPN